MRVRKAVALFILALTILPAGLVFQNCSAVRLAKLPLTYMSSSAADYKAYVCPRIAPQQYENTKFLFMIDMSRSNIGAWVQKYDSSNRFLGANWDFSKATDLAGDRFTAIQSFIDNCGGAGSSNQFAVLGFSKFSGVIVPKNGEPTLECKSQFGNKTQATADLKKFKDEQTRVIPWYKQWERTYLTNTNYPGIMLGYTGYSSALECTKTIFLEDLVSQTVQGANSYHFFFLSDGAPFDGKDTGCEKKATAAEKELCYLMGIHDPTRYMGQAAIAMSKSLRIYSVAYGEAEASFSKYLDAISDDGGTGNAVVLQDFKNDPDALCRIIGSQLAIDFRPDFAQAVNLTTTRRHGHLTSDSDMDGIPDEDEVALGYTPNNPRSNSGAPGVLDGICNLIGTKSECATRRNLVTCNPNIRNKLYLSDCDIKILGLDKVGDPATQGIDSDGDGMLDFVEILKGTDPTTDDMGRDPDGDGINNLHEIMMGLDPKTSDANVPNVERTVVTSRLIGKDPTTPACNGGAWELGIKQMPSKSTYGLVDPIDPSLDHRDGEQIALLFYRLSATNSGKSGSEYYATTSRFVYRQETVKTDQSIEEHGYLEPVSGQVNPTPSSDFERVDNGP